MAEPSWTTRDSLALTLITFIGGALRFWRVAIPAGKIFDETYYAKDACWYAKASEKICGISDEQTAVHPPLGKWLISVGIRIFGYHSFGWRIVCVVAGTLTIALLYLLARKLLRSTLGAISCTSLFAVDFLHFVQSRTSMLDVFVPLFGVAAVLAVLYDRDVLIGKLEANLDPELERSSGRSGAFRSGFLSRPWRIAAGALGGAATACKWSGAFMLLAVIVLCLVYEIGSRNALGLSHPFLRTLNEDGLYLILCLGVLPVAIYVLSYAGRLDGTLLAWPWTQGSWWRAWWERQLYMESFHHHLTAQHSYESPAWTWLLLKRPVSYYFTTTAGGKYDEIFASGNPFVWWAAIPSLLYVAIAWVRSREWAGPEALIVTGFAASYLPWLFPQLGRPAIFLFYLLPSVPFMYLALGYVAVRLGRSWEANTARALFAVGAAGLFVFYYPLLAAVPIPQNQWNTRISIHVRVLGYELDLFDDCEKPQGPVTTSTITTTIKGTETTRETRKRDNSSLPPRGWCWI